MTYICSFERSVSPYRGAATAPQPSPASISATPLPQPIGARPTARFWETLFHNLGYNFEAVYEVIDSILTAPDRCRTALYVQAVATPQASFLVSNLGALNRDYRLTLAGSHWLLGRSARCDIPVRHPAIASCHAAISQAPDGTFCLTDGGSAAGTTLNGRRLPPQEKHGLRNGDRLAIGTVQLEFLIDKFGSTASLETAYF